MALLPKIFTIIILLVPLPLTAAVAIRSTNSTLPEVSWNNGDPSLRCVPARWIDIAAFYLGNYVAHAATVKSLPGEGVRSTIFVILGALLFPTLGAIRGLQAFFSFAKFAKTDLQTAARAGALCVVVRKPDWKPMAGDIVQDAILKSGTVILNKDTEENTIRNDLHARVYDPPWIESGSAKLVRSDRKIHGLFPLPEGYQFAYLPGNADLSSGDSHVTLSAGYSVVKILVALGQLLYATFTLYHSRGTQITQYGFAAFGLTVAPYAVMSIVNLCGNLMAPDYPTLYTISTPIMEEAQKRTDSLFQGVVGKLNAESYTHKKTLSGSLSWIDDPLIFREDSETRLHVELTTSTITSQHSSLTKFTTAAGSLKAPDAALSVAHCLALKHRLSNVYADDRILNMSHHSVLLVPSASPFQILKTKPTSPGLNVRHCAARHPRNETKSGYLDFGALQLRNAL